MYIYSKILGEVTISKCQSEGSSQNFQEKGNLQNHERVDVNIF
jgi:hypothetical protein